MDTATIPVKGELSPEYLAIQKNFTNLIYVLDLPTNKRIASRRLIESEVINPPGDIPGKDMVDSVLKHVRFRVVKFYTFLCILQSLRDTGDILKDLQREFFSKEVTI